MLLLPKFVRRKEYYYTIYVVFGPITLLSTSSSDIEIRCVLVVVVVMNYFLLLLLPSRLMSDF